MEEMGGGNGGGAGRRVHFPFKTNGSWSQLSWVRGLSLWDGPQA